MKKPIFTTDWFSNNIPVWSRLLEPLAHAPHLRFVEVGSWEGRSACWLLQNVVTHPSSRLTCIDTFAGSSEHHDRPEWRASLTGLEQRFRANIEAAGGADRVDILTGASVAMLRTVPMHSLDFAYIDGSHAAPDVLMDILHTWPLLKAEGILALDDYPLNLTDSPLGGPKPAIDAFLAIYKGQYEPLHEDYQIIVRKKAGAEV